MHRTGLRVLLIRVYAGFSLLLYSIPIRQILMPLRIYIESKLNNAPFASALLFVGKPLSRKLVAVHFGDRISMRH